MRGRRPKSPKPSAASFRRPEPVLFLDRSLGRKVAAGALRDAGMVVELHDDHFAPDCPDQTWLTEVGSRGWLVLTKDQRIRYRKSELQAVQEAGVGLFVLTAGQLTAQEIGAAFVSALPAMRRLIAKRPRPFVARVSRNGGVALLDLGGP